MKETRNIKERKTQMFHRKGRNIDRKKCAIVYLDKFKIKHSYKNLLETEKKTHLLNEQSYVYICRLKLILVNRYEISNTNFRLLHNRTVLSIFAL